VSGSPVSIATVSLWNALAAGAGERGKAAELLTIQT
jgi:hypothetical protein